MKLLKVLAAIFLLMALCSCNRVLSKQKMAHILADIFVLDEWLNENHLEKTKADTTLYYDAIFARHGVTFEEFNYSISYYSNEIEKYIEVIDESAKILEVKEAKYRELERVNAENRKINLDNMVAYKRGEFPTDSLLSTVLRFWPEMREVDKVSGVLKKNRILDEKRKSDIKLRINEQ